MKDWISRLAAALAVLAVPAAAGAQVAPAVPVAAPVVSPDLRTIVEAFAPRALMETMLGSAMETVYRGRLASDPEWQKIERDHPGISEVRIAALRSAVAERLPEVQSALQADVAAFWSRNSTPGEQALFAAYLRTSLPQRMNSGELRPRAGEMLADALSRQIAETKASATPVERRREAAFYATAAGRKANRLTAQYDIESKARKDEIIGVLMKYAMDKARAAAQAFIDSRQGS